ncbi:hypothetical protein VTK73DRAFT_5042 [Phialemonium thermophilum]|uniref:Uncharacterized protein n=1 Tax=Phialemonium thermophilum TaxID=223376 RepID=A0ABR3V5C3_9PEZI
MRTALPLVLVVAVGAGPLNHKSACGIIKTAGPNPLSPSPPIARPLLPDYRVSGRPAQSSQGQAGRDKVGWGRGFDIGTVLRDKVLPLHFRLVGSQAPWDARDRKGE